MCIVYKLPSLCIAEAQIAWEKEKERESLEHCRLKQVIIDRYKVYPAIKKPMPLILLVLSPTIYIIKRACVLRKDALDFPDQYLWC